MQANIAFLASPAPEAQTALAELTAQYGNCPLEDAKVIVALGGDGFMLQALHSTQELDTPVYGMNRGTVGFMMNAYRVDGLLARLEQAEMAVLNPLRMTATRIDGTKADALAINEVSLLRQGAQAAKLRIVVDGRQRLDELVCDGVILSTPAGSTAYNYSAHGPILPIGSDVLALTPVAAFRPRRWRGALLPKGSHVRFEVIDPAKRPVMADADSRSVRNVLRVDVASDSRVAHKLLFDPGHGLEERLIREQFV
ncbi:NAD kinase [Roseinatronobacter alkalisoli]|uniref:NAD kinase n=1 Tax=Roseinatronobacter alkalisoli TaxID=3028235 RepID=A0ABT5T701_9RHOB|nr:NAD kinase [Roseinatronobacter sp. HJB301]MDD7970746.1 NAD kinase [Roseinatronobacter sp. HJB301]